MTARPSRLAVIVYFRPSGRRRGRGDSSKGGQAGEAFVEGAGAFVEIPARKGMGRANFAAEIERNKIKRKKI